MGILWAHTGAIGCMGLIFTMRLHYRTSLHTLAGEENNQPKSTGLTLKRLKNSRATTLQSHYTCSSSTYWWTNAF